MVNAKKANTKRIYFLEQGLDINVLEDYRQGMKYFKQAAFESTEYYVNLQKEKGLFVELRISREGKSIKIEVWNNTTIAAMEEMRMMNKIKKGEQYANLEDVLGETVDDIEGSGLGLIILILMMKKIGLEKKHRKISVAKQGGNTIVGLKIPVNK